MATKKTKKQTQVIIPKKVTPGNHYPLGATSVKGGVNFAIYSKHAQGVELLLFDKATDSQPTHVIKVENKTRFVWHCMVEGISAGQLYSYRIYGDYKPEEGLRFNPNRVLLDPYAKAITGKYNRKICSLGYDPFSAMSDLSFNIDDNIQGAPKCVVVDDNSFNWEGDKLPEIPMNEMIIYEAHIKGMTAHPSSKVKNKGTYLGVIQKIPYLKKLGITSIEFLPVHHCQDEDFLLEKGLSNYWGYNTLGYFAPDVRYSTESYPGCQVDEFKEMVKSLHSEGIEVILDVVYNHTCEGNEKGPTYCYKGVDNPTYYNLASNKRYYMDYTGCGNSLNFDDPQVVKLVMDSLRYWVEEMHVDGFRFDLASVLGREHGCFDQVSSFFVTIHQDPVLSKVKLIAEPWDIGWDSYQVGNFPIDWAEWNGKYRDCIRKFLKGDSMKLPEMGYRLTGSSDLYSDDGRTPFHSINFITCHDGFTLYDLVSYASKHNEANLENNRDGNDDNNSWNWGAEGETDDPYINELRKKMAKNYLTILILSQGIPMLLAGDEFLKTQKGNNNAYCQDNDINYLNWTLADKNKDIVEFSKKLISLRKKYPHFTRKNFFTGADRNLDNIKDITWYDENLNEPEWSNPEKRILCFLLQGEEVEGKSVKEDFMVIINSFWEERHCKLPANGEEKWYRILDTSLKSGQDIVEEEKVLLTEMQDCYKANARSIVVLLRK